MKAILPKIMHIITSLIPIILLFVAIMISNMPILNITIKWAVLIVVVASSIGLLLINKFHHPALYKLLTILAYLSACGILIYAFLYKYDLMKYFSSITAIKELILSSGTMGGVIFVIIQIAQVVFLPIPAVALIIVGIVVYGPIWTAILCSIGVLVGSYLSFMVGKTFGYKFVSWMLGEDKVNKYSNILRNNGKIILTLVFLFPMLPDDLFCMIAGISPMTFKEFFAIATLVRPITIIVLCVFGGSSIISFSNPLGLIIMLAVIIAVIITVLVTLRKNKKVRSMLLKLQGCKHKKIS